jgi:hypothetical protein
MLRTLSHLFLSEGGNSDVKILFYGTLAYKRERTGVLGPLLNSNPLALQHLMSILMNFYVGT